MQKLLEVLEIWLVLNLVTMAFILWHRSPRYRLKKKNPARLARAGPV